MEEVVDGRLGDARIAQVLHRLPHQNAGPRHIRRGHARSRRRAPIVLDPIAAIERVRQRAHDPLAWRGQHMTVSLAEATEIAAGIHARNRRHIWADSRIREARRVVGLK